MCSPADAGISTKSAPQGFCCACSSAKSEVLFSADVCESVRSVPFGRFGAVCYAKSIEYFSTNVCERAEYV